MYQPRLHMYEWEKNRKIAKKQENQWKKAAQRYHTKNYESISDYACSETEVKSLRDFFSQIHTVKFWNVSDWQLIQ